MASQRQNRLGRILDLSGPGTYNEETGRWNNGKDVPLVTDTPVYSFQQTPIQRAQSIQQATQNLFKSHSPTPSSRPSSSSNTDFKSAIDESIERSRRNSSSQDDDEMKKARIEDNRRRLKALPPSHNDVKPDLAEQLIKEAIQREGSDSIYISSSQYDYLKSQAATGNQDSAKVLSIVNAYLKNKQMEIRDSSRLAKNHYPLG